MTMRADSLEAINTYVANDQLLFQCSQWWLRATQNGEITTSSLFPLKMDTEQINGKVHRTKSQQSKSVGTARSVFGSFPSRLSALFPPIHLFHSEPPLVAEKA